MAARPRLKEQFRPLRRGGGRVQLGLDPAVGVVLEGLSDDEILLLEHLDGSLDEAATTAWAVRHGIPAERVAALLQTLRSHALTVESPAHRLDLAGLAPALRDTLRPDAAALACAYRSTDDGYAVLGRRARRRVVVSGTGSLPTVLVQALRQAGVGHVLSGRYAGDPPAEAGWPDLWCWWGWAPSTPRRPRGGGAGACHTCPWCSTGPAPRWARWSCPAPVPACGASTSRGPTTTPAGPPCSPSSPPPPWVRRRRPPVRRPSSSRRPAWRR